MAHATESTDPSRRFRPAVLAAAALTVAYMLAATVGVIITGNGEFLFYLLVMVVLIAIVAVVHWRVNLSGPAIWCLAVWGGLHMAGGLVPVPESWPINGDIHVLYSWWLIPELLKYDHVVHAFGFFTTALVCWEGLRSVVPMIRPTFGPLLLIATASMGFGAANEIVEFIATLLGPTNVGGYVNTAWDLVSNAVGATAAAVLIRITDWRGSKPTHRGN
jgi:hypothetical protein